MEPTSRTLRIVSLLGMLALTAALSITIEHVISPSAQTVATISQRAVISSTAAGKAAMAETKALGAARQPELDKLVAAMNKAREAKAPAADILAAQTKAAEFSAETDAKVKEKLDATANEVWASVFDALPGYIKAHGIREMAYAENLVYVDPKLDVSADLAKEYDARAAASPETVRDLQAKVSTLERDAQARAAAAKGPTVAEAKKQ